MDGPSSAGRERPALGREQEPVALVFAAGGAPEEGLLGHLPEAGLVVAADSGLATARALGVRADLLVGDLDSVEAADVESARAEGTRVEAHPTEKDQIDLELALDAASDLGARRIVVVAGPGGRLDMALANVAVLTRDRYTHLEVEAWIGRGWLAVVRAPRRLALRGRPGETVSILPVGGPATAATDGLRYPLHDEVLLPGTSRGISNEILGTDASVQVGSGVLLVVRPDALENPT